MAITWAAAWLALDVVVAVMLVGHGLWEPALVLATSVGVLDAQGHIGAVRGALADLLTAVRLARDGVEVPTWRPVQREARTSLSVGLAAHHAAVAPRDSPAARSFAQIVAGASLPLSDICIQPLARKPKAISAQPAEGSKVCAPDQFCRAALRS